MIHALPGMGGDHRMFPDPWTGLPGFCAHDWPRHQGERTLSEVAAPIEWLRLSAGTIPADLAQMFATAEVSFVRQMCRAIFEWEGLGAASTHCVRIHGGRDLVIPHPPHAHLLLEDGGHLISMTHAGRCVEFIEANQSRQSTAAPPRRWA